RGRIFGQGQSFNARKQSPDGTEQIVRAPELVGRLFLTQLLGNPEEEAETPLLGNEVLADGGKVYNDNRVAMRSQTTCGSYNQRGFANLPSIQDVTVVAARQCRV